MKSKLIIFTLLIGLVNSPLESKASNNTLTGLDVLQKTKFNLLKNKKVGVITNHSALDRKGEYILDIFSKQNKFELKAIFTPEHGLRGKEDKEFIPSEVYGKDIPVNSLYGKNKKPNKSMLKGLDVLVYDIQDIGTRYFTYITTMAYCMEVAAENNLEFIVLDRPNPINGNIVEGEVLNEKYKSFTGYFPIATRYAMTSGEVATYYNKSKKLGLNLKIIKLENWQRNLFYDQTGLKWLSPSPNMRELSAAILYPGFGTFETFNFSVGRGTEKPFIYYGSPWLDNKKLVNQLNSHKFPGLSFSTIEYIPKYSVYKNQLVKGFKVDVLDKNKAKSVEAMIYAVDYINNNHPNKLIPNKNNGIRRSFGSGLLADLVNHKYEPEEIVKIIKRNQIEFLETRKKYLLY